MSYLRGTYDALVSLRMIDLIDDPEPGPESRDVIIEIRYSTRPKVEPETVTINLLGGSLKGFQFDGDRQLIVEVDGQQIPLGEMRLDLHQHEIGTRTKPENFSEALILTVPFEQIGSIFQAKKVKMRVGTVKFSWAGSAVKTLRKYFAEIDPDQLTQ